MEPEKPLETSLPQLAEGDVARLVLRSGGTVEGSYLTQAGMHFIHVRDGGASRVEGPFSPDDVSEVALLKSRNEVIEDARERRLGVRVAGSLVETRGGYRARLERLASVAAREESFRRRMQVTAQFDDVADRIALAKTKRRWMLAEARWRLHSNEEPDKLSMAGGDITKAEGLARPRPQDFDPDQAVRRRREPLPAHVAEDPLSPPNMLNALRSAGFTARVSVLSEMAFDRCDLLVDFPGGKRAGRFLVKGSRADGAMRWTTSWEGGSSSAGLSRMRRCLRSQEHAEFMAVVGTGAAKAAEAAQDACDGSRPGMR